MGWNEPGTGKDPWGRPQGGGQPDLDAFIKRLRNRFGDRGPGSAPILAMLAAAAALVWLLSGVYAVKPAERGVVLQFGKLSRISEQGLHWHLPYPVESVTKLNVDEVQTLADHATLLTRDQNVLELTWNVQYRIDDVRKFLASTARPEDALKEAALGALREAVGSSSVDDVFYEGRARIAAESRGRLQGMLNAYQSGLQIVDLKLQEVEPPQSVSQAFAEVAKVHEEEKAKLADAQAYAGTVLPQARGEAMRQVQEAEGYRSSVIERAKGETARFLAVLAQYDKAPQVTRKRLYLDAMETILSRTSKVVVDMRSGGNPTIYLPIDQLLRQTPATAAPAPKSPDAPAATSKPPLVTAPAEDYRSRERSP